MVFRPQAWEKFRPGPIQGRGDLPRGGGTAGSKNKGEKVKTFLNYPEAPLPRDIRLSAKQIQGST